MARAIAFYILVIIAVPVAFLSPYYGVLIYQFFSYAHPEGYVWHSYMINYGLLIAVATMAGYVLFQVRSAPPRIRGLGHLVLFWVWLGFAAFAAEYPVLAIPKFWEYTRLFLMLFIIASMLNSVQRIRDMLRVMALSLGATAMKSAAGLIITAGGARLKGPGGKIGGENEYATALVMAIPLLFYLAKSEEKKWLKYLMWVMVFASGMSVIGTRSREGLLGLVGVSLAIAAYSRRKVASAVVLVVLAVATFTFAPKAALQRYATLDSDVAHTDMSAYSRIVSWKVGWEMVKDHPIFGVGLRNFVPMYSHYSTFGPFEAHSVYVGIAAEAGLPCLILFLVIIIGCAWTGIRIRRKLPDEPQYAALRNYTLGIQISITVGFVIPGFFNNLQSFEMLYHCVALMACLDRVTIAIVDEKLRSTAYNWEEGESSAAPELAGGAAVSGTRESMQWGSDLRNAY